MAPSIHKFKRQMLPRIIEKHGLKFSNKLLIIDDIADIAGYGISEKSLIRKI